MQGAFRNAVHGLASSGGDQGSVCPPLIHCCCSLDPSLYEKCGLMPPTIRCFSFSCLPCSDCLPALLHHLGHRYQHLVFILNHSFQRRTRSFSSHLMLFHPEPTSPSIKSTNPAFCLLPCSLILLAFRNHFIWGMSSTHSRDLDLTF